MTDVPGLRPVDGEARRVAGPDRAPSQGGLGLHRPRSATVVVVVVIVIVIVVVFIGNSEMVQAIEIQK